MNIDIRQKLESDLLRIEMVLISLNNAIALLHRIRKGEVTLDINDKEISNLALKHYVINNLVSLFEPGSKPQSLTLATIASRHRANFCDLFNEYQASLRVIRQKCSSDFKRLKNIRILSSAHLDSGDYKKLGRRPKEALHVTQVLGAEEQVVEDEAFVYVTVEELLDMHIVSEIPKLKSMIINLVVEAGQFSSDDPGVS